MILSRNELIEIILRQYRNFNKGALSETQKLMIEISTNKQLLQEARKSGIQCELRNGQFIINQKLS